MCKCQLLPPPLPVTTKPLSQKAGRTSVGQNHKKRTSATLPPAHSHADVEVLLLAQHGLGELLLRAALRAHQLRGDRQRSHGVNSFAYGSLSRDRICIQRLNEGGGGARPPPPLRPRICPPGAGRWASWAERIPTGPQKS